jgi:hypothetical protein
MLPVAAAPIPDGHRCLLRRAARAALLRRIVRGAGLTIVFGAAAVAATWPLARHISDSLPIEPRDPLLTTWILAWDAQRASHLLRGVWEAPLLYPYQHTLAFSEHLLGIALFTAPLQWASNNPVLACNAALLASYVLAAAGMYLLVFELTGRRDAAVVAALAFALCPIRRAQLTRLQIEMVGWMPIALWAVHRYARRGDRRWAAAAAAAFCLQGLSNGYYLYFLVLPIAIVALWMQVTGQLPLRRTLAHAAVAAIAVGLVFVPIARVYVDVRQRYDLRRSLEDNARFSADVGSYLHVTPAIREHFAPARWLPDFNKPDTPLETKEGELFPGFVPLGLAAIALLWRRPARRDAVVPYAAIAVAAFALSLGPQPTAWGHPFWPANPYMALFKVVPGLDGLRVPARLGVVVALALCVLAGLGAARLLERRRPYASAAFVVAATALLLADTAGGDIPLARIGRRGRLPERSIYERIAAGPPGAVLELPIGRMDYDYRGFRYAYASLIHGHRLINGWTGYSTPLQQFLGGPASPLREAGELDEALELLRGLGVRYVVIHPADFDDAALARHITASLDHLAGSVRKLDEWDSIGLYEVAPSTVAADDPPGPPVAIGAVTASHGTERLPYAFDHDLETRWTTATPQSGDEWLRVAVRPRDAATMLVIGVHPRSLADYARLLEVDAESEGRIRVVFRGSILQPLGRALARAPDNIRVRIPLESCDEGCEIDALRLRQIGRTAGDWSWSIDELEIER